jgi:hypothetical protein
VERLKGWRICHTNGRSRVDELVKTKKKKNELLYMTLFVLRNNVKVLAPENYNQLVQQLIVVEVGPRLIISSLPTRPPLETIALAQLQESPQNNLDASSPKQKAHRLQSYWNP